eukprot:6202460-Pyramimonas_sp.AAC.1
MAIGWWCSTLGPTGFGSGCDGQCFESCRGRFTGRTGVLLVGGPPFACAWLQAAEGEADSKQAHRGALAVAGFNKYYERIPLTMLRDKYISFNAPTAFLKLACNMWRAPRVL